MRAHSAGVCAARRPRRSCCARSSASGEERAAHVDIAPERGRAIRVRAPQTRMPRPGKTRRQLMPCSFERALLRVGQLDLQVHHALQASLAGALCTPGARRCGHTRRRRGRTAGNSDPVSRASRSTTGSRDSRARRWFPDARMRQQRTLDSTSSWQRAPPARVPGRAARPGWQSGRLLEHSAPGSALSWHLLDLDREARRLLRRYRATPGATTRCPARRRGQSPHRGTQSLIDGPSAPRRRAPSPGPRAPAMSPSHSRAELDVADAAAILEEAAHGSPRYP